MSLGKLVQHTSTMSSNLSSRKLKIQIRLVAVKIQDKRRSRVVSSQHGTDSDLDDRIRINKQIWREAFPCRTCSCFRNSQTACSE
ncbi:hypothetical protein M426DRAFT_200633 [Hypoxylon sp. CI-4A]|nr:hypothetical protein M426DRAFT_200633 [Hypoxylon sp. CI-4A]